MATSGGLLSIMRADGQVQREAGSSLVKGHSQRFSLAEHLGVLTVTSHYLSGSGSKQNYTLKQADFKGDRHTHTLVEEFPSILTEA